MESKENTDFGKITFLEFFKIAHKKLFWNFRFLVSSASILKKKHFFWLFSWSLPVWCLPVMFITESVMIRDVKIKVGWFSSEHRWKRKNLWISAENDWISMRAQPGGIQEPIGSKHLLLYMREEFQFPFQFHILITLAIQFILMIILYFGSLLFRVVWL